MRDRTDDDMIADCTCPYRGTWGHFSKCPSLVKRERRGIDGLKNDPTALIEYRRGLT